MDNTTLTIIWTVIGIILFPIILKNKAPYGRHITKKWGKTISNKTGWIIMELPALLICPIFYFVNTTNPYSLNTFFVGLWIIHYINRTIIFPFRIKTKGKKMPLAIAISAIFFNTINGVINGYFLSVTDYSFSNSLLILTGFFIFFIGLVLNIHSDNKLISLRENTQVNNYAIPKGGLFNKISCPNFFGELTEWFGFAIMTFNIGSLSFFVWTFINLVPRALSHHNWYKINFENYPKNRKVIIPYIL